MQAHEYSIVGHNRASIGRYLGALAALVASLVAAATISLVQVLNNYGFPAWTHKIVMVSLTGGIAYTAAHWLFNRFGWRFLSFFSQVPHIGGSWICSGRTINMDGETQFEWSAKITISQNWEKIRVRSETSTSASNSVSAALIPEPDGCWMLMYSYRNEPCVGEPELRPHVGYCELRFDKELNSADGDYFNAKGRGSFGRMSLKKEKK
jgi:hypothetical protein